jgi:hypothetical protein
MANYTIDSMTYGSNTYTFTVPFGTCSTAGSTAAKSVACTNFTALETGARVAVKFTYTNSHSAPTLNVNNTGAKTITWVGGTHITRAWNAGSVIDFVYDGTNWCIVGYDSNTQIDEPSALFSTGQGVMIDEMYELVVPYATTTQYGVVKPAAKRSSSITASTGGTTSGRYYGVEMDSSGKLFVNVPTGNPTYSYNSNTGILTITY